MRIPSFIQRAAFLLHLSFIPFHLFCQQDRIYTLQNQAGLVRIILADKFNNEYLIYEAYLALMGS